MFQAVNRLARDVARLSKHREDLEANASNEFEMHSCLCSSNAVWQGAHQMRKQQGERVIAEVTPLRCRLPVVSLADAEHELFYVLCYSSSVAFQAVNTGQCLRLCACGRGTFSCHCFKASDQT